MKRLFCAFLLLGWVSSVYCVNISGGDKLYLCPNSNWLVDNARFAAYFFRGDTYAWAGMTAVSGTNYYVVTAPSGTWSNVIFCRMNGSTGTNSWNNKWNQTGDLTYDGTNNLFTIPSGSWDGATTQWSYYDDGSGSPMTFYVAGTMNGWNAAADEMTDGFITYTQLPAQTYEFKITNGTWNVSWGYANLDCRNTNIACTESGEYGGNISFTLTSATDVTIGFDGTDISVHVPNGITNCGGLGGRVGNYNVKPGMGDVILQGFYYNSYGNSDAEFSYNTRWTTLNSEVTALNKFDIVWLPPSAMASGTGYHPKQWSNQNSDWGTASELSTLINNLHAGGTKVMADIVVNHRDNQSTWCNFYPDDFGVYGSYQLTAAHICSDDEVNSGDNGCRATGGNDSGYMGVAPVDGVYGAWIGARDLDHNSTYVRQNVKSYLMWLRNVIGYDAFRWDMGKGFSPTYFNEYNYVSDPYMSVIEMWEGSSDVLADFLSYCRPESDYYKPWSEANPGSMLFDFSLKYGALHDGIGAGAFENLRGKGMLGAGNARYAVTFVDNHDTYRDNNCLAKVYDGRNKILQAYAYILSMPGVPCVFYPHWKSFTNEINALIDARHAVGVNSTSPVDDSETGDNTYRATIQGRNGYLIIRIGADIYGHAPGSDYKIATEGYGYRVYVPVSVTLGNLPSTTTYYLTGASLVGSWAPNAQEMTNGTVTINNVQAGTYAFKITTGTWDTSFGYSDLGVVSGVATSSDNDGNVVITLTEERDLTISIVNRRINISSSSASQHVVTAMEETQSTAECSVENGVLRVSAQDDDRVYVYDVAGRMLCSGKGGMSVRLNRGVYIVRCKDATQKIIVR